MRILYYKLENISVQVYQNQIKIIIASAASTVR